jgi:site-specific recombinase XerD
MHPTANQQLKETLIRIDGAYAPSTIRAYKANFERFIDFCTNLGICALPADSAKVANYVGRLTKSSLKSSSIRLAVASISSIHKLNSLNDPTQHPEVKIEMRRMHRTLGCQSKQAYGITAPMLEKILESTENNLRGVRDRALLLLAYDSMCRRSELVSLKFDDIISNDLECLSETKIRLRKSKTDPEQKGRWIFPSQRTIEANQIWIDQAKISDGYLFRGINNAFEITKELNCGQINRIYKRLAIQAGIERDIVKQISGHSMRVGAAQDLLISGASIAFIMNKGRWSKIDTVMRYLEGTNINLVKP